MTDEPAVACDLDVFDAGESARHGELSGRLLAPEVRREELPDGYALRLAWGPGVLREVAEWVELERRCCPFLSFTLSLEAGAEQMRLELRGPAGTKEALGAGVQRRR